MTQIILASGKGMMLSNAASPFQSNLSSWQNSAEDHMHAHAHRATVWQEHDFNCNVTFVILPVLISAAWLLITGSSSGSSGVVSNEGSQEISARHWLPTGVTMSPFSGARMSLSGVPLFSCYLFLSVDTENLPFFQRSTKVEKASITLVVRVHCIN